MLKSMLRGHSPIPISGDVLARITQFNRGPRDPGRPDLLERRQCLAAVVAEYAAFLAPDDAELVRAIYSRGVSPNELARLIGTSPNNVRRRACRLVARMRSPAFGFVIRQRDQWTPLMREVASACILHAMTLQHAAATLRISYHTARRYRDLVLRMAESARTQSRRASYALT